MQSKLKKYKLLFKVECEVAFFTRSLRIFHFSQKSEGFWCFGFIDNLYIKDQIPVSNTYDYNFLVYFVNCTTI